MTKNRRELMQQGLLLGAGGTLGLLTTSPVSAQDDPAKAKSANDESAVDDRDRQAVLAAGLTAAEADCWAATAQAAGTFFALPEMHPLDAHEVASAIHVIQNKLLSRPTYRKYLEEAKRLAGEK